MRLSLKSEWFVFESPIGEPNEKYYDNEYHIQRVVNSDNEIIWFGISVNWKKTPDGPWTVLSTNENALPLEKYLPEIVYGEDRIYWKPCEPPIYEKKYEEYQKKVTK